MMLRNGVSRCTGLLAMMAGVLIAPAFPQNPARPPRYVEPTPIDFNDHAGWKSMFDGKSLAGWDGPTDVWRAENGEIVAQSFAAKPGGSTYLIWQGGEPGNFEFKAEIKLLGEVAGQPHSKWDLRGYQADFDLQNANTGALIECCAGPRRGVPPRPDRAYRGQMVRSTVKDGEKPSLLAIFGDPDQLKSYINISDWNEIHLIARGRTMAF
jgi:hypothetical protein